MKRGGNGRKERRKLNKKDMIVIHHHLMRMKIRKDVKKRNRRKDHRNRTRGL